MKNNNHGKRFGFFSSAKLSISFFALIAGLLLLGGRIGENWRVNIVYIDLMDLVEVQKDNWASCSNIGAYKLNKDTLRKEIPLLDQRFNSLSKLSSSPFSIHRNLGILSLLDGKLRTAESHFSTAAHSGDLLSYLLLVDTQISLGELIMTGEAFTKLGQKAEDIFIKRGEILLYEGEGSAALYCLDLAVKHNPPSFLAHLWRGRMLLTLDKYQEATSEFNLSIQICPECSLGYLYRGYTLLEGKTGTPEEINLDFQTALELDPRNGDVALNWARWLQSQNETDNAIAQFDLVISMYPDWDLPYSYLASFYVDLGERNEAIAILEKGIDQMPDAVLLRQMHSELTLDN